MIKLITGLIKQAATLKLGIISKKLIEAAGKPILAEITNRENQQKAYELIIRLNENQDLTSPEKARVFNELFRQWAAIEGRKMKDSVINCLREMAFTAVNAGK